MIILFRNNLKAYSGWSFKGPYAPLGNQTPAHDHRAWLGIAWPGLARCGTAGAARCGTAGAAWQGTAGKGCCGAWQERMRDRHQADNFRGKSFRTWNLLGDIWKIKIIICSVRS